MPATAKLGKRVQLRGLRDPVVISILPEAQLCEDRVLFVDRAIAIVVILREGKEAVPQRASGRLRLRRGVSEHLGAIVDDAVTVAVQDEPGVIAVRFRPCPCTW